MIIKVLLFRSILNELASIQNHSNLTALSFKSLHVNQNKNYIQMFNVLCVEFNKHGLLW